MDQEIQQLCCIYHTRFIKYSVHIIGNMATSCNVWLKHIPSHLVLLLEHYTWDVNSLSTTSNFSYEYEIETKCHTDMFSDSLIYSSFHYDQSRASKIIELANQSSSF